MNDYDGCVLCPRECGVNRSRGNVGYCGETARLRAGLAYLHQWEEPCISGSKGSGTVFFSGCSMRCVFCQNGVLARSQRGDEITVESLAQIFWELREQGAHNVNLVTAAHFLPHVIRAIEMVKKEGFELPFVYNTGGYEKVDSLKRLDGLIDVYLPDFKFWKEETSIRYAKAPGYPEVVKAAIREMVRQVGDFHTDPDGLVQKGVIVRHLVLPGHVLEAKHIAEYLHKEYGDTMYMSFMSQYTPMEGLAQWPELTRRLRKKEYERVLDFLLEHDIMNVYIQEGSVAQESFIPDFNGKGISK